MKKNSYVSALLCAAALMAGCSNEEALQNEADASNTTLVATTGADSRTTVDATDYKVKWAAGDAFYAFGTTAHGTLTLSTGVGETTGTFKGTIVGSKSNLTSAVYPSANYNPTTGTLTFPTTYTYPNSNAPMFGKVSDGAVAFDQLLSGMMRIKVGGIAANTACSLELAAEGIEGTFPLTFDSEKAILGTFAKGNTGKVTLNFTTPAEGTDPMVLDIPVPKGTYSSGIEATLKIGVATGEVFKTTASFTVDAGKLKEMPEINVIDIDANTNGIIFSKVVETVAEANKELAAGATNVTIAEVKTNDEIVLPATASTSAETPAVINITSVDANASLTIKGNSTSDAPKSVVINAPASSTGTLTVTDIEHVEISGDWTKVTSSTGDNTLVVKAGAKVAALTVNKGNIAIENGAVVNELTLGADVTINSQLVIPASTKMVIKLCDHTLTLAGNNHTHVNGELVITGTSKTSSKVVDNTKASDGASGIALTTDCAKFTMTNATYETGNDSWGVFNNQNIQGTSITITGSEMKSGWFCVATNAQTGPTGATTITLSNSIFTANETALMVNTPSTVTATSCTFTGGWQGAFLRGGTTTFDKCSINLNVTTYGTSTKAQGSVWGSGNNAPAAAITGGNRSKSAYDYKTSITLTNGCTFSATTNYPAIYLDADPTKSNQGVTLTADATSAINYKAAGTGLVTNTANSSAITVTESK